MTTQEKEILTKASEVSEPLKEALNLLPDQNTTDPLMRQLLDAGRSLLAWVNFLCLETPGSIGPDGTIVPKPIDGQPINKKLVEHIATIALYAESAAYKLMIKEEEEKLRNQYKWCMALCQYQQKAIVAILWDYYKS